MPMIKKGSTATPPATAPVAEAPKTTAPAAANGTAAAVNRLKKKTETTTTTASAKTESKYVGRDFDKEARGKSLCLLYGHAIGSALIAGTKFEDLQGAFNNMKFFVEAAMNEIFPE